MKLRIWINFIAAFFLCIVVAQTVFAQESFSGEVGMKITDDEGNAMNLKYFIKDNLFRINSAADGQNIGVIFNSADKKMLMIMDDQKMYMEMPMDMMNKYMENNGDESNKEIDFKKTGETKKILDYTCEKWIYTGDDNNAEIWMAKNMGAFRFFDGGGMGKPKMKSGWEAEIEKSGYFPMQVITRDKSGNIQSQMEVTSVTKKSLDDSFFKVPAGYQKFSMPNMQ
ncbi:MAG: DUF4412 domain-containing protein [Ignavibacteriales bacterium]|nr:MAG: DUF4412 domain-containing protein [Ignavibacteriales bacterium]